MLFGEDKEGPLMTQCPSGDKGQLAGVSPLPPLCGAWESKSRLSGLAAGAFTSCYLHSLQASFSLAELNGRKTVRQLPPEEYVGPCPSKIGRTLYLLPFRNNLDLNQ